MVCVRQVAACQWHAFSNDRSEAEIEPTTFWSVASQTHQYSCGFAGIWGQNGDFYFFLQSSTPVFIGIPWFFTSKHFLIDFSTVSIFLHGDKLGTRTFCYYCLPALTLLYIRPLSQLAASFGDKNGDTDNCLQRNTSDHLFLDSHSSLVIRQVYSPDVFPVLG